MYFAHFRRPDVTVVSNQSELTTIFRMVQKGLLLSLLFLLAGIVPLMAQGMGDINFRDINVEEMTDTQLQQINQEVQDRGINMQQFEQLAIAQGGDPREIRRLVSRLQEVRLRGDDSREDSTPRRPARETRLIGNLDDQEFVDMQSDSLLPDSLQIFGMDLFEQVSMSFEPSFNVPTPENYSIGAGDQLVIDIWGAAEQTYQLLVDAEGTIRIQNLGPVQVSGMTIEEANRRVVERLADIYSGLRPHNPSEANTWARVSLGNIRTVKVTLTGEVKRPGTYSVSSLATMFNALYSAGGPTRKGSFRNVQLIRRGEPIHTFDLYDFLVHGNQEDNIRLKDQDVIKIDPYINRVQVLGETKRIGFFEMKEGETLGDLIEYASGFTDSAYTRTLTLTGRTPTMRRVNTVLWPEASDTKIGNGDRLQVGKLLERYENRVTIRGSVERPGHFELEEGMTLYDLIQQADGLSDEAFMGRGVITRLQDNREQKRIGFSPERLMENPSSYDVPLRRDDVVEIASIFDMREEYNIRVSGAVNRPTTYSYADNMTIEDAIFMADGFRDEAAAYRIELARRVTGDDDSAQYKMDRIAETYSFDVEEGLGFRGEDADFRLMPFDQVYVRTKPNYQEQQTVRITGEVQYPGEYVISSRDARLSDLVEWAGGLSDFAYVEGASLQRILEITAETEITELEGIGLEGLSIGNNGEESDENNENNRNDRDDGSWEARRDTVNTPVGIRLGEALVDKQSNNDLILEPGDELHIPKQLQTVRVEGEVLSPTSIRYDDSHSFSYYLDAAGGVTEDARRRRAYVVYANGEVDRTKRVLFFRNNPTIEPGATIIVPPKPLAREMTPQERISLASSLASTALLIVTLLDRLK